jgi:hypothetical protein
LDLGWKYDEILLEGECFLSFATIVIYIHIYGLGFNPFDGFDMCNLMKGRGNVVVNGDSVSSASPNFPRQNMLVEDFFANNYPQVLYLDLDVYPSTVLRVDSHPDPLHIIGVGGHLEIWFVFIYNTFRLIRSLSAMNGV